MPMDCRGDKMKNTYRTICQGCHSECGVLVAVEDGRVVNIAGDPNHPVSRGHICVKGKNYAEFLYHPDRLTHPLKRAGAKGSGKWERVSWDEALDDIAQKLTEIKDTSGHESISTLNGTGPRPSVFSTGFLAGALGTPNNVSTDLHICYAPSMVAEICTVGGPVMQEVGPDYLNARCVLVCGGNPLVSHPDRGRDLMEGLKKNNGKLIVIDPRLTRLAGKADQWLQIRPGTDLALILAMIHTIIAEDLHDKEFVQKWCHGFDELRKHVASFSPDVIAELTWLPADQIRETARLYAMTKPAVLHHRVAIEHNINSTQTNRALLNLIAITGNLGVKGGNLLPTPVPGYISTGAALDLSTLSPEMEAKRLGGKEFPLISGPDGKFIFVHAALAAEAMLTGTPYPLKAMFCAGGNPIVNMQNTRRAWEAFKQLDLFVVSDFFMTPTAELADYVLPATMWPERNECCDQQYMSCIAARQRVVEPAGETRDDIQIVMDLVERIPWANRANLPWTTVDEFNNFRLAGTGLTFEDLRAKGYLTVDREYEQYRNGPLSTPTGKVELYSTIFETHGHDPLPVYVEPPQGPVSTPELMEEYPLVLITGSRKIEYFHSEGRQISALRKREPNPEMEIHPDAATAREIKDGDWVWIETPLVPGERVRLKAKVTDRIHPRVVSAPHGWWFPENPDPDHGCFESNISVLLTDDEPREPICGSVPLRGTLCKVYG